MTNDSIEDFILKSERNFHVAAAVGDAWPAARARIVSGFLDRLDLRLKRRLKGWLSSREGGVFFVDPYPGYYLWKPRWKNYCVALQCHEFGKRTVFGVTRERDRLGKRPFCQDLFSAVTGLHPSARQVAWWEAIITMRSPADDWRAPDVLWRLHTDKEFLNEVADQLLQVAKASEPLIDRLSRRK